ncbi:MAG: YigZ family protein [Planctomycetes bacterium]|nr:YigZ family protein [Planctomycetota bacterium]
MSTESEKPDPDRFQGVLDGPEIETKVKGSRFRAQVFGVDSEVQAKERLLALRKQYHDATHHCSGLRLLQDDTRWERADDDGEPSGTAGVPILGALIREDLIAAFCVVTRWFGGTKLGSGGLVRAYGDAAREAVEAAPRRVIWRESVLHLDCDWEMIGAVEAELARHEDRWHGVDRDFGERARLAIRLPRGRAPSFRDLLVEATGGRVKIETRDEDRP